MTEKQAEEQVKKKLVDYLHEMGHLPDKAGRYHCIDPTHNDRIPSMTINKSGLYATCWSHPSPKDSFTLFDAIGIFEGIRSTRMQKQRAFERYGVEVDAEETKKQPVAANSSSQEDRAKKTAAKTTESSARPKETAASRSEPKETVKPSVEKETVRQKKPAGVQPDPIFEPAKQSAQEATRPVPEKVADSAKSETKKPVETPAVSRAVTKPPTEPVGQATDKQPVEPAVKEIKPGSIDFREWKKRVAYQFEQPLQSAEAKQPEKVKQPEEASEPKAEPVEQPEVATAAPAEEPVAEPEEKPALQVALVEQAENEVSPTAEETPVAEKIDAKQPEEALEQPAELVEQAKAAKATVVEEEPVTEPVEAERPVDEPDLQTESAEQPDEAALQPTSSEKVVDNQPINMAVLLDSPDVAEQLTAWSKTHTTGFDELDQLLDGGLRPGLTLLCAGPGEGKTSFALQIADHMASQGQDVLWISFNLCCAELMTRSLSRLSLSMDQTINKVQACPGHEVSDGLSRRLSRNSRQVLFDRVVQQYRNTMQSFYCYESWHEPAWQDIRQVIEQHAEKTGQAPLVVLDSLQPLRSMTQQSIESAVQLDSLIQLSRRLCLPILCLSSDLNRCDSADVILNMRLNPASGILTDPHLVELEIKKNAHGPVGRKVTYNFYAAFYCFEAIVDE